MRTWTNAEGGVWKEKVTVVTDDQKKGGETTESKRKGPRKGNGRSLLVREGPKERIEDKNEVCESVEVDGGYRTIEGLI